MDDTELLKGIKTRLNITGNYHDDLLLEYAQDVKDYLLSAGVKPRVISGSTSIGCITRGVADLWNYGAGDGKFSEVFYQRVIQLATPVAGMEDGSEDYDPIEDEFIEDLVEDDMPEPEPEYEIMDKEDIEDIFNQVSDSDEEPGESTEDEGEDEEDYEPIPDDFLEDLVEKTD